MARLALALVDGTEVPDRVLLDRRSLSAVAPMLGEIILLYRLAAGQALFLSTARLAGIDAETEGRFSCRFDQVMELPGVPMRPQPENARTRRLLRLEPGEFSAIVREGRLVPIDDGGLLEATSPFSGPLTDTRPTLVYRQVLEAYGWRCAVTGESFAPGPVVHPHLHLTFLRPRRRGGPIHVRNLVPMIKSAHRAWTAGTISATPDHRLVVVVRDLDLRLFDRIETLDRLHLPRDKRYWPDPAHLGFHFATIFGRATV